MGEKGDFEPEEVSYINKSIHSYSFETRSAFTHSYQTVDYLVKGQFIENSLQFV